MASTERPTHSGMAGFFRALFATTARVVGTLVAVAIIIVGGIWAFFALSAPPVPVKPDIAMAPLSDDGLKDPDNPAKLYRVDFAKVEAEHPLSRADLAKLTPENLVTFSQEEIDQIYGRLTAGPIPDGPYSGTLFLARGDTLNQRLGEIVGGLPGRIVDDKLDAIERVGALLWKGKMFDRQNGTLRNFIEDLAPIAPFITDVATVPKADVPRGGFLGKFLPTTSVWMLFPAKVYCGQSLVDGRRESIIVDYLFGDEIDGYRASPDSLVGRGGLRVRDEIRMVRPGFYLGRAYANRAFLLNFTLYNPQVAEAEGANFAAGAPTTEECWSGDQSRIAATK